MKTALFTNFTTEDFIGYWDGKAKKFEAGKATYMPDYLANHFAKHLVNRELLRIDENGNAIYKDGEKFTSPKKPQDIPIYMELFNKAYKLDGTDEENAKKDDIDTLIEVANKNREEDGKEVIKETKVADPTKPQVVLPPDFEDEDDDSEESFGGKPV